MTKCRPQLSVDCHTSRKNALPFARREVRENLIPVGSTPTMFKKHAPVQYFGRLNTKDEAIFQGGSEEAMISYRGYHFIFNSTMYCDNMTLRVWFGAVDKFEKCIMPLGRFHNQKQRFQSSRVRN